MRRKLIFFVLIASVLLFVMNASALENDLYIVTVWADIVSHSLGGVVVGGLLLYFFLFFGKSPKMLPVLLSTFIIGILWEYFELSYGLTYSDRPGYALDTFGDLIFDVLGAYAACLFISKKTYARS